MSNSIDIDALIAEVDQLNAEFAYTRQDTVPAEYKENAGRYFYERQARLIRGSAETLAQYAALPRAWPGCTQEDLDEMADLANGFKSRIPAWKEHRNDLDWLAEAYPQHDWDVMRAAISQIIEQTEKLPGDRLTALRES
jgi:hypothetical protein